MVRVPGRYLRRILQQISIAKEISTFFISHDKSCMISLLRNALWQPQQWCHQNKSQKLFIQISIDQELWDEILKGILTGLLYIQYFYVNENEMMMAKMLARFLRDPDFPTRFCGHSRPKGLASPCEDIHPNKYFNLKFILEFVGIRSLQTLY